MDTRSHDDGTERARDGGLVFLLAAFRLMGKRQVGQLTPFDLVVLLIISNVLQNAMIGPDNSITGGLIGARSELHAALRDAGMCDPSEARFVFLESTGRMTAGPKT